MIGEEITMTRVEIEQIKKHRHGIVRNLCAAYENAIGAIQEALDERGEGPDLTKARQLLREWNGE